MKISQLSDKVLLQQTLHLVKKEKELLSEILLHLQEVQRRRLYCDLGFGSLFQYCVKQLGYSEDQAYRRINALKMVREFPEIQEQISLGELTLSTLSVAQALFKTDAILDKKEILEALKHKSRREAEKIVREFSPKIPELKKELKISLNGVQEEKWQSVKAKLAHCNLTEDQILEKLCDFFLAPQPVPRARVVVEKDEPRPAPPRSSALASKPVPMISKAIPAQIKCQVKERSQNLCTNCGSKYALEIDHLVPRALGGTNHPSNLRVLCRACNQRAAVRIFGKEKMQKYLEKS